MNFEQLNQRVKWQWVGYGTYKVTIIYNRKQYTCISHNTIANDDYQSEHRTYYKTDKQCLSAFYEECKRKNCIGSYFVV